MEIQWPDWFTLTNPTFQFVLTSIITIIAAAIFGDRAGNRASIRYQEKKDARALPIQLRILETVCRDACEILDSYEIHPTNTKLAPIRKFPTAIFERSILSIDSAIINASYNNLLSAIESYLFLATQINPFIEKEFTQDNLAVPHNPVRIDGSYVTLTPYDRIHQLLKVSNRGENINNSLQRIVDEIHKARKLIDYQNTPRLRRLFKKSPPKE